MVLCFFIFFFKQKTAYEVRISDWSSDVCSSDLAQPVQMGEQRRPAIAMVNDHDPSVATIFPRKGDTASGRRHNLRQRLRQNSEPACAHPAFRKFAKASHHFADNGETICRRTTKGLHRCSRTEENKTELQS